jgi:hypothetical protein
MLLEHYGLKPSDDTLSYKRDKASSLVSKIAHY